jgi:hypothetical protein
VVKPLLVIVTLKYMKEFILERIPMHVNNVRKPLLIPKSSNAFKNSFWRKVMDVSNVGKPSLPSVTFEDMKEGTLKRIQ